MRGAQAIGVALLHVLGTVASAQSTGLLWGDEIPCNAADDGALRPRVAVNGSGFPVVLWGDHQPMVQRVAVGDGTAFSAPVEVSAGLVPSVAEWMGGDIAAAGPTVWVVMKATPEETRPVYVRRSDDGGFTWGDTLRVDPFDDRVSRFPSIAVADPEAPLVQYMQFDSGYFGARQVVSRRTGGVFSAPVQVSAPFAPGEVCDCCTGQVVAAADGAIALYRNAGSDLRVIWGAASTDGGLSFPEGGLLDQTAWQVSLCPSSGPDGVLAGDSMRYVWMSAAVNGAKVYIGTAAAADLGAGPQGLVFPGQPQNQLQNFPRIAGSGDTLGVVWQQQQSGQTEILFSWSVTGPAGLSAPDTVNGVLTSAQRTPDIAYADGVFHIVWSEPNTGQVRYRSARLVNTAGLPEAGPVEPVRAAPNPATDQVRVSGGPWTTATFHDLQGRTVARRTVLHGRIDLLGLAPGTYTVRLRGRSKEAGTFRLCIAG